MTMFLLLGVLSTPALANDIPMVFLEAAWSEDSLTAALASSDWELRHQAGVARMWRDQPGLSADLWAVEPQLTRARFVRFWGGIVDEPGAETMLLDRLIHGDESAGTRHALVDAIARSGSDYGQAFVALMPAEPDGWVRAAYVQSLRKQAEGLALPMFRQGLNDRDGYVRAEAARSLGWHQDGARLATELIGALEDGDAQVREASARSLGVLRVGLAFDAVAELLEDDNAEVRLQALHAVERIDPLRAALVSGPLLEDNDPRVRRLAVRVLGR